MTIALRSVFVNSPAMVFRFYTEILGFVKRLYVPEANMAIVAAPDDAGGTGCCLSQMTTRLLNHTRKLFLNQDYR